MPTPVAHSIAAVVIALLARRKHLVIPVVAALVFLANLPDMDFIPGYLVGEPRAFHWGATHSIVGTLGAGIVGGLVLGYFTKNYAFSILLATTAYGSHVLMDMMAGGASPVPVGLQLLWPFSTEPYRLEWDVFRMAPGPIASAGPIGIMLSSSVFPMIWRELTVMIPFLLVAIFLRPFLVSSGTDPRAAFEREKTVPSDGLSNQ